MEHYGVPPGARLDGQVAVVTGAGRGIGRATALILARAGAAVVASARTASEIEETVSIIRQRGGRALAIPADICDWNAMLRLRETVKQALGSVDVIVSNAAVFNSAGEAGDLWTANPDGWAQSVGINLVGQFHTVRAFLPDMVERNQGVVIFVSSAAAVIPVPGWSSYCSAKAGLNHLASVLAAEVNQKNLAIRVHCAYPSIVQTDMQERLRALSPEQFAWVEQFRQYHNKGILRSPEEPATLIWWLATPLGAAWHGKLADLDDAAVRRQIAVDLGTPMFKDVAF